MTECYRMNEVQEVKQWYKAAHVDDFPKNGGVCVKVDGLQIAVFNFTSRNEWFACPNDPFKGDDRRSKRNSESSVPFSQKNVFPRNGRKPGR